MQTELRDIFTQYRQKRKQHTESSWNNSLNIWKRWKNANSGILDNLWSEDFNFANDVFDITENEIRELSPSKSDIDKFILKMSVNENELANRLFYLGITPAILAAILAITTAEPSMKWTFVIVTGFLSIGFFIEQNFLNIEKTINNEIKEILKSYKEQITN